MRGRMPSRGDAASLEIMRDSGASSAPSDSGVNIQDGRNHTELFRPPRDLPRKYGSSFCLANSICDCTEFRISSMYCRHSTNPRCAFLCDSNGDLASPFMSKGSNHVVIKACQLT